MGKGDPDYGKFVSSYQYKEISEQTGGKRKDLGNPPGGHGGSFCLQPAALALYVVTAREKIRELAAVSQYSVFAAAAPVDTSAALENLWIETDAQGLGGVWMGVYLRPERMAAVGKIAGLPAEEEAFAMFSLGYSGEETRKHDRFQEEWIRWIE